jgi:hypothetical protein
MLAKTLRFFSYIYHVPLSLFLFGLGLVGWMSPSAALRVPWFAWEGDHAKVLMAGGAFGLFAVLLAITGKCRPLFALWTLAVVVMFVRGFFWGPYAYSGADEFKQVLWLFAGAVLAFLASLTGLRKSPDRR